MSSEANPSPQPPTIEPSPTVGRIVHVHFPKHGTNEIGPPCAAIVTNVYSPEISTPATITAHVYQPGGHGSPMTSIPHKSTAVAGYPYWTWPPRV